MRGTSVGDLEVPAFLLAGTTPAFELQRDGQTVQSLRSATPIRTTITLQDWVYHGGGGTKLPKCDP